MNTGPMTMGQVTNWSRTLAQAFFTGLMGLGTVAVATCGGREEPSPVESAAAVGAILTAKAVDGEQLYQQRCVSCHQLNGQGLPATFPPLAGSEFATAVKPAVAISIVLNGLEGPIVVKGSQFSGIMPPYGLGVEMSNEEVAAVLSYVRASWGNRASAVTPQDVARVRGAARARTGPMTAEELQSMM